LRCLHLRRVASRESGAGRIAAMLPTIRLNVGATNGGDALILARRLAREHGVFARLRAR